MTQSNDHGQARARLTASRRAVLIAAGMAPVMVDHALAAGSPAPLFLALNECAYPPSSRVAQAIAAETGQLSRYADPADAGRLTATLARIEQVTPDQIVLGDVLEPLGRYLAAGTGGSFVYSLPGYTALVDAAKPLGGRGVGVPLDRGLGNDLAALSAATGSDTRALFLVNPHNPSGTVTPRAAWHAFLAEAAHRTLVIVDEAYIEYDERATARSRSPDRAQMWRCFALSTRSTRWPRCRLVTPWCHWRWAEPCALPELAIRTPCRGWRWRRLLRLSKIPRVLPRRARPIWRRANVCTLQSMLWG
jgi:hypothetical protein